jgi:hypothetical protein
LNNHNCEKINIQIFPVLADLLRLLELGSMLLFSGRGKEHSKEESKNWRRRRRWKISKTKMNVSIITIVVGSVS